MSLLPKIRIDKHCLIYCGPERCDCKAGTPYEEWLQSPEAQIAIQEKEEEKVSVDKLTKAIVNNLNLDTEGEFQVRDEDTGRMLTVSVLKKKASFDELTQESASPNPTLLCG